MPRGMRIRLIRTVAPSHTVGAVCLIENEGLLLMLRQRHRPGWTLPGGLVNRGETAVAAVCREVREETGLRVEVDLPIGTFVEPRTRRVDVVFHVVADSRPEVRAGSEAVRADWLRLDQLGQVDEPTAQVLALFARSRQPGRYTGRVLPSGSQQR
jgi:8-oxo-dGTP diphosphatase